MQQAALDSVLVVVFLLMSARAESGRGHPGRTFDLHLQSGSWQSKNVNRKLVASTTHDDVKKLPREVFGTAGPLVEQTETQIPATLDSGSRVKRFSSTTSQASSNQQQQQQQQQQFGSSQPSITIEVTSSNDTLITVFFTDIPKDFAVLVNLPFADGNNRSAIYISMQPVDTASYSGTITFMSPKANSTVGFNIPTSPNNAVITVDVPQDMDVMDSSGHVHAGKKTKIKLVHLGGAGGSPAGGGSATTLEPYGVLTPLPNHGASTQSKELPTTSTSFTEQPGSMGISFRQETTPTTHPYLLTPKRVTAEDHLPLTTSPWAVELSTNDDSKKPSITSSTTTTSKQSSTSKSSPSTSLATMTSSTMPPSETAPSFDDTLADATDPTLPKPDYSVSNSTSGPGSSNNPGTAVASRTWISTAVPGATSELGNPATVPTNASISQTVPTSGLAADDSGHTVPLTVPSNATSSISTTVQSRTSNSDNIPMRISDLVTVPTSTANPGTLSTNFISNSSESQSSTRPSHSSVATTTKDISNIVPFTPSATPSKATTITPEASTKTQTVKPEPSTSEIPRSRAMPRMTTRITTSESTIATQTTLIMHTTTITPLTTTAQTPSTKSLPLTTTQQIPSTPPPPLTTKQIPSTTPPPLTTQQIPSTTAQIPSTTIETSSTTPQIPSTTAQTPSTTIETTTKIATTPMITMTIPKNITTTPTKQLTTRLPIISKSSSTDPPSSIDTRPIIHSTTSAAFLTTLSSAPSPSANSTIGNTIGSPTVADTVLISTMSSSAITSTAANSEIPNTKSIIPEDVSADATSPLARTGLYISTPTTWTTSSTKSPTASILSTMPEQSTVDLTRISIAAASTTNTVRTDQETSENTSKTTSSMALMNPLITTRCPCPKNFTDPLATQETDRGASNTVEPYAHPKYWIRTVLQGVASEVNDTFKVQMKEALRATYEEAFFVQQQQHLLGVRLRRKRRRSVVTSALVSVEMINVTALESGNKIEMVYYLRHNGSVIPAKMAVKAIELMDEQVVALHLGHIVHIKAEPYLKEPTPELYAGKDSSILLPVVLGSLVVLLLVILSAILVHRYTDCCKFAGTGCITLATRNRQQTFDEEGASSISIAGHAVGGKNEAGNIWSSAARRPLPMVFHQNEDNPPPVPSRSKSKRRPLPHPSRNDSRQVEYTNVAAVRASTSTEQLIESASNLKRQTAASRKPKRTLVEVYRVDSVDGYDETDGKDGIFKYLQPVLAASSGTEDKSSKDATSPSGSKARGHSLALPVATQTDSDDKSQEYSASIRTERASAARRIESEKEVERMQAEIQMQTMRQRMQEILDDAFSLLRNKKTSTPRLQQRNALQPRSSDQLHVHDRQPSSSPQQRDDKSAENWTTDGKVSATWADPSNSLPLHSLQNIATQPAGSILQDGSSTNHRLPLSRADTSTSLNSRELGSNRHAHAVQMPAINGLRHELNASPSTMPATVMRRRDSETQYLIRTIKDELQKFRSTLSAEYTVI